MQRVHAHALRAVAMDPVVRVVCSPKEGTNGDTIPALLTSDGLEGASGENCRSKHFETISYSPSHFRLIWDVREV